MNSYDRLRNYDHAKPGFLTQKSVDVIVVIGVLLICLIEIANLMLG